MIIEQSLGWIAFDAYREKVGNRTYDGKPIPSWETVSDSVKEGWEAAAKAVVEHSDFKAVLRHEHEKRKGQAIDRRKAMPK